MIKVIKNSKYLILFCLLLIPSLVFSEEIPGARYTGTYKKSGPIEYANKNTIIIEGLEINASNSYCIVLWSCENVIIRNCKFTSAPNKRAVYIDKCKNVTITDCYFENVYEGVLAAHCKGNIKVDHNDFKNIRGKLDGGSYFVSAVQFHTISGVGNSINYNSIENINGKSSPEDIINIYASNGTSESPITVKGNWLRGGGPNPSGCGINLGDWGGSYQIAEDNILVNPGQIGMGISGGHHMTLRNNTIYAKRQSFTNVGLSICNWTENKTGNSYSITVENNEINWTHRDGFLNKWWIYINMNHLKGKETNKENKKLNESILPEVIINRARKTEIDNLKDKDIMTPDSPITQVYSDRFDRIAIKYLVPTNSTPTAYAEGYSAKGQLLISMALPRYNQSFPISVPKGEYYVKITYPELGKSETTKIIIK